MKKTNKCPKCGSDQLIVVPGKNMPAESGRFIMTGMTTMSAALFERYVCSECGYSEEYFDKANIDKLVDKFGIK